MPNPLPGRVPEPTEVLDRPDLVDIDVSSVIDNYPQLREMPARDAEIVIYYATGMTIVEIGNRVNLSRQTVYDTLKKYDITKVIRRGVEMQKLLLANSIGSIMVSAVQQIKTKHKEMKDMSIHGLMNLIKVCSDVQKHLNPPERRDETTTDDLVQSLKKLVKPVDKGDDQ